MSTSTSVETVSIAGRAVVRVGYGAMQLTHGGRVTPDDARTVLRFAVDLGMNHIDTAWFYGAGAGNELIRDALAPYPDDLVIATKVGADNAPDGALVAAQQPRQLRRQVEDNLTSLGVESLDLVYLRRLDAPPGIVAEGEQVVDLEDQLAELAALRDAGKIRAIGLSQVDTGRLRRALPVGIAAVQNRYNLLDRTDEPVLDVCSEYDVAWIPYIPLGSAFAGARKVPEDGTVQQVAEEVGATPTQVALAWLLAHEERTVLIPGTTSTAHLEENLAAADLRLEPGVMARLDALAG